MCAAQAHWFTYNISATYIERTLTNVQRIESVLGCSVCSLSHRFQDSEEYAFINNLRYNSSILLKIRFHFYLLKCLTSNNQVTGSYSSSWKVTKHAGNGIKHLIKSLKLTEVMRSWSVDSLRFWVSKKNQMVWQCVWVCACEKTKLKVFSVSLSIMNLNPLCYSAVVI